MAAYVLGIVVFILLAFIFYRKWIVHKQRIALNEKRLGRMRELVNKFESGIVPTADEVRSFAYAIATRESTYALLNEKGRLDLFPRELLTIEKGAEANLANWLEFPTELGALPDEMEHLKRVTIAVDATANAHYEVFKFRVNGPHWAAKDGWILGVAGPYFDNSKPYDLPSATFSRFSSKLGTIEPDDEAKWVHQNLVLKA
jgi:hypothetical protein